VRKRVFAIITLIFIVLLLAGCGEINEPITAESEGFWNQFIVYPLSWLIIQIASLFPGSWGYGLSIIIITIMIRLVLLPLMIKQIQSSRKMQMIQPELEALRKKYSSKDAVTQRKFQQEQMLLMQKYDINPMSGCLPILIQIPVLFGFYHAIIRTEEIRGSSFLWFSLSEPDFILPLIAGMTTYFQQKALMKGQNNNPQMTMMLWMMPIMILVFSFLVPSALPLYWIIGNLFSIAQSYFIKTPELAGVKKETSVSGRRGGKKK